jgi:hypothetical protein
MAGIRFSAHFRWVVISAFSLGSKMDNLSYPADNKVFADFK